MANLKRLMAPSFWGISKKDKKWVVAPHPGPHPKSYSIPLSTLLTSILKTAEKTSEAKKIIRKGEVYVDGKKRKDYAYPVGLFDVISLPKLKKHYRVVPSEKKLEVIEISEKESNLKIFRIKNKTVLKKGKAQLNLHDGKNILVDNDNYKTGDSLLLELPSLKLVEQLPLQKGNVGVVFKGHSSGKIGSVKELKEGGLKETPKIVCEIEKEDKVVEKDSFIVVGKNSPLIKIASK